VLGTVVGLLLLKCTIALVTWVVALCSGVGGWSMLSGFLVFWFYLFNPI
jgi:hypothetical protein